MSDQTPAVPVETPAPQKKRFPHPSRKTLAGFAAGITTAVVAAVAITKLGGSTDSEENEVPDVTVETFVDPADPTA